jgi:toxin-antitoxin system PIN domain toxin
LIALDTNILVYADRADLPQHAEAREFLEDLSRGLEPCGLPVFALVEYVRVVTHPRLFSSPTRLSDALSNVDSLLSIPVFRLLLPGDRFWELFDRLSREADARGNLAFDTQIAALCLEHHVGELCTADRDFARYPGLHTRNPLGA